MTGYRHRYAESLTEWAELHGEPVERTTGTLTERCAVHGEHVPQASGDCGRCLDDMDAWARDRRTAWSTADGADRADAWHDAHQQ